MLALQIKLFYIASIFHPPISDTKMIMNIVNEWKVVTQSVTTSLTSSLPKDCTPVKFIGDFSLPSKVVEEWGEEPWELEDWEVDARLGWGSWDWTIKPMR